jgi:hypothetical protein
MLIDNITKLHNWLTPLDFTRSYCFCRVKQLGQTSRNQDKAEYLGHIFWQIMFHQSIYYVLADAKNRNSLNDLETYRDFIQNKPLINIYGHGYGQITPAQVQSLIKNKRLKYKVLRKLKSEYFEEINGYFHSIGRKDIMDLVQITMIEDLKDRRRFTEAEENELLYLFID